MKERTMNETYDALALGSIEDREVLRLGRFATFAAALLALLALAALV